MLLFNNVTVPLGFNAPHFNTSNVTIQQQKKDIKTTKMDFNTSNVTIQRRREWSSNRHYV